MKKVLLTTLHASHNYGAVLQAYALQRAVKQLGFECEILDFRPPEEMKKNAIFKKIFSFNSFMRNIVSLFLYPVLKQKSKKFQQFITQHLSCTRQRYVSAEEVFAHPPKANIYLTGSDQVWNTRFVGENGVYFLAFPAQGKRIAFSPSAGEGAKDVSRSLATKMASWWGQYETITVRDQSTADLVQQLTGRSVKITLDPTLLWCAKDYDTVAAQPLCSAPYIFFYVIKNHTRYYQIARQVSRYFHLPVIVSSLSGRGDFSPCFHFRLNSGPAEFISLIKHCKMVVTSSFHGTIFSVLYRKPFLSLDGRTDVRISVLLKTLGLEQRGIATAEEAREMLPRMYQIDYDEVFSRLDAARDSSWACLKNMLGQEKNAER